MVVPARQDRLTSFKDLVKNDFRIQLRGNYSSTHRILTNFEGKDSLVRNNKHLMSLAKSAEFAPQDHHECLEHLGKTRKTVAMNTVAKVDNYLRYLHKYYSHSECLKGEELILVAKIANAFIPPYSELLRKTSDQLFESGISQMYRQITERRRTEYDDSRMFPVYQNRSSEGLKHSLDFSLDDPQGKITFYLALMGLGLGLIVIWAEMAWNPVKSASKYVYGCTKKASNKTYGATRSLIKQFLCSNTNQEREVTIVQTCEANLEAP